MVRRVSLPSVMLGMLVCAFAMVLLGASLAYGAPKDGEVRIHVMPCNNTDAIIVECDGMFGVVDSGEDSLSPDGTDERYPLRGGITVGQGIESQVISYMETLGITQDNLEFYIGTHPHSDHIGSAADVIRKFHPKTVYTPPYCDSYISEESRRWDNRFVYDRLVEAVESYDGKFVQYLDPDWTEAAEPDVGGDEGGIEDAAGSGEVPGGGGVASGNANGDEPGGSSTGSGEEGGNGGELEDAAVKRELLTGRPSFTLGSAQIEIMNYDPVDTDYSIYRVPDANRFSYAVLVTAPNGRKAFLAGDIDDYSQGWSLGGGDETKIAQTLRNVDFLKMAHHGRQGSNTPSFLTAIMRPMVNGVRPVAVQTGSYRLLPEQTIQALHRIGAKHFNATSESDNGYLALVATLGDSGVTTNVDHTGLLLQKRSSAPWAFYYLDGVPQIQRTGWQMVDGAWRYFEGDGSLAMGWRQVGSKNYYLRWSDGSMATGWHHEGDKHYYLQSDGSLYVGKGWTKFGNRWFYYADASGAVKVGWLREKGKWYYLSPDDGAMATGWAKADGAWYYLDGSGAMRTGWQKIGGKWYYLRGSGAMAEGWAKVSGAWYYLRPGSGAMATGWAKADGAWYYLDGSGAMRTGWLKDKGKWYYLTGSGAMATGERVIGGVSYSFDDSGALR